MHALRYAFLALATLSLLTGLGGQIRYGLTLKEDWDNFFGAVVLFDNAAYERVNGFHNIYRGCGQEDLGRLLPPLPATCPPE